MVSLTTMQLSHVHASNVHLLATPPALTPALDEARFVPCGSFTELLAEDTCQSTKRGERRSRAREKDERRRRVREGQEREERSDRGEEVIWRRESEERGLTQAVESVRLAF